jgi:hypothetical protein
MELLVARPLGENELGMGVTWSVPALEAGWRRLKPAGQSISDF